MQEINLLQNKVKDRTLQFERSNRLLLIVFSLILALEVLAIVGLYLLTDSAKSETKKISDENARIKNEMNADKKTLTAAQGLQAQLKNIKTLLQNHVYWTEFFNQVSAVVPNKVKFRTMSSSVSDNHMHIEGVAQSYQDIGRLLLSLNGSDKFKDVKLHSILPSDTGDYGYAFSMDLSVNPNIFSKSTRP